MWERFTKMSHKAIEAAEEEAKRDGSNYISTEHLLLGLLHAPKSVACIILTRTNHVSLKVLRRLTEWQMNTGDMPPQPLQFTQNALRVFKAASNEADRLNNRYIGTEHLLLGLLSVKEGLAARVLAAQKVTLETVRQQVLALQEDDLGA